MNDLKEIIAMATDRRSQNPADEIARLVDLISDERQKLEEALAAINEYADRLKRVASDTGQRLLTKD